MVCTIEELNKIIARLRKVKYGDLVLSADHNDLVNAVKCLRDLTAVPPPPKGLMAEFDAFIPPFEVVATGTGTKNWIIEKVCKTIEFGKIKHVVSVLGEIWGTWLYQEIDAPPQRGAFIAAFRDKTKKPTVEPGDIFWDNVGFADTAYYAEDYAGIWEVWIIASIGGYDDFDNIIEEGDEICLDICVGRKDVSAGTNLLRFYYWESVGLYSFI